MSFMIGPAMRAHRLLGLGVAGLVVSAVRRNRGQSAIAPSCTSRTCPASSKRHLWTVEPVGGTTRHKEG
jgi:hypothetical protein